MHIHVFTAKWGEKFGAEFYNRLYTMVERNTNHDFTFWCITNEPSFLHEKIEIIHPSIELENSWSKMEVFNQHLPIDKGDLCMFLDADVVIQNNIDTLIDSIDPSKLNLILSRWAYATRIGRGGLEHLWLPNHNINSSVMIWKHGTLSEIHIDLLSDPNVSIEYRDFYRNMRGGGTDNYLWGEHRHELNFFPKGHIYSRVLGFEMSDDQINNCIESNVLKWENPSQWFNAEYTICIFNGYKSLSHSGEGYICDDTDYEGYEVYWEGADE